ncbi:YhcN/YlaJ family sporulation lipoprotein [Oceanobacillus polygoni]|nr:YhcN/YlaJ family sporulation lipoprotein [Oceanobacillus polygoni]
MMKWKVLSIAAATILTMTACQATDNNARDNATGPNDNIEQTRFYNNAGEGMTNVRNYTLDRDSERFQNRDDGRYRANEQNQYDISEEAAERITEKVNGIDRAYVLTTDNNAYVAATLDTDRNMNMNSGTRDNGDELTDEVKEEIGDIVKSVDNGIDNVYVSTNPDFIDLTNNYVDDVNNGQPIEGFFDQMGNMIERLFPQNRR